jgi:hypothetical protein
MNKNVMELFAGLEEKVEEIIESNTKKEVLEQAEMCRICTKSTYVIQRFTGCNDTRIQRML